MKILAAIQSDKNATIMQDYTLRWAARAGYNMRIFIPDKRQLQKYEKAIEDANYHHYLALPNTIIETGDPLEYAKKEGYDLLIYLPDNLEYWNKKGGQDLTHIYYAEDVGKARVLFSNNPKKKSHKFRNGAEMVRV